MKSLGLTCGIAALEAYEKVGSVHLEGINASLRESDSGDETPLIKIPSGVPGAA